MERTTDTIILLAHIKSLWQEQATDRLTVAAWHEYLAALNFDDLKQAVGARVKAGLPRPACAELYRDALAIRDSRLRRERDRMRKLDYVQSEEERAANKAKFREILAALTRKLGRQL